MGFLETCPKRTSLDRATGPDDLAARNGRYPHISRGRLVKHARCYWLMLAESHLTPAVMGTWYGRPVR